MADPIIRHAQVAVLIKLETTEGIDASPSAAVDAIPVEADSVDYNNPWTTENSNEATGSLVVGAPLVIGQAATIKFRSRIKGAGPGATYTSSVKPPLHQALQACGKRGQFTAAIATAVATAGSATTATLGTGFAATLRAYLGMPLIIGAGIGNGHMPLVTEYTAGRIATLSDTFSPALDTTTSLALPANWTYGGTSPRGLSARATDHPSATIYIYEDGVLRRFIACRGATDLDGQSARPGMGGFSYMGIYAGKSDVDIPSTLVIANHLAPVLVQGAGLPPAMLLDRKPLPISTWSLEDGGAVSTPDDPNTSYGFGPGVIGARTPTLKLDPLATLTSVRDLVSSMGAGTQMTAALRHGSVAGNRWSLTVPLGQIVGDDPGKRDALRSEQISLRALDPGFDAQTRNGEAILCFS